MVKIIRPSLVITIGFSTRAQKQLIVLLIEVSMKMKINLCIIKKSLITYLLQAIIISLWMYHA